MTENRAVQSRGSPIDGAGDAQTLVDAIANDGGCTDAGNLHLWLTHLAITADRLIEAAGRLEEALERGDEGRQTGWRPLTIAAERTGPPGDTPPSPRLFQREGEYWTIAEGGTTIRLRDLKGLSYLAYLLGRPGTEVHVADLAAETGTNPRPEGWDSAALWRNDHDLHVDNRLGDALLDREAKASYGRRLEELEDELSEASRFHDMERAARAREERDTLLAQLAEAVGLGGRDRRTASAAERARVNVTRTVRAAIDRIGRAHPTLGRHLAVSVRTGTFCCYDPDPGAAESWST